MKIWTKINCLFSNGRSACTGCSYVFVVTGAAPANPAEELVHRIAGARTELPLDWLEKEVRHELYTRELREGSHVLDIGLLGPELFCQDAARLLSQVRPQFGHIREAAASHGGTLPRASV